MEKRGRLLAMAGLVLAANVCLVLCMRSAKAAGYQRGSAGTGVQQLQTALQREGYYTGSLDGIYGSGTEAAVRRYQEAHGLEADGKAGKNTLASLGLSAESTAAYSSEEQLLARLISAEARGEPYAGQVAVGAVVLNRVEHPSFPNSIAGVIYQSGAFSCLADGQFDEPISESAYRAAREALNGADPSGGAIYYFNPSTATSRWIWSRPLITVIGKHRFCA